MRVVMRRDGGRNFVYQSAIANATHYPDSGEGPNEHALTYLKDGSTILCILRAYGDGRCGSTGCERGPPCPEPVRSLANQSRLGARRPAVQALAALLLHGPRSLLDGARLHQPRGKLQQSSLCVFRVPQEKPAAQYKMGCVRPRLLKTDPGPILLIGGRTCADNVSGIFLWLNPDGMGEVWERHSLSYWHNELWSGDAKYKYSPLINSTAGWESQAYMSLLRTGPSEAVVTYNKYMEDNAGGGSAGFAMRVTVV